MVRKDKLGRAQVQGNDSQGMLGRRSTASKSMSLKRLDFEERYRCPACGSGEISAIAMMDVFACNFCRHMFTANLQTQSIQLVDSLQPMTWHWAGGRWKTSQQRDTVAVLVWAFGGALTVVPVGLIVISNYIFPPLEGSNFPLLWAGLTFLSHGVMSSWLLAEYYRWPWYIGGRVRLQRWCDRWLTEEGV